MTTRGFLEADFEKVADWCIKAVKISVRLQEKAGKQLVNFLAALKEDEEIRIVSEEVKVFSRQFSMPGL